jgi:hypothetical protein
LEIRVSRAVLCGGRGQIRLAPTLGYPTRDQLGHPTSLECFLEKLTFHLVVSRVAGLALGPIGRRLINACSEALRRFAHPKAMGIGRQTAKSFRSRGFAASDRPY